MTPMPLPAMTWPTGGDRLEADPDHIGPLTADVPEARARCRAAERQAARLRQHGRVQPGGAGRHPPLADRHAPGAADQLRELPEPARGDVAGVGGKRGLPEALLFGIMAKESNGRVHASSRAGAAGLCSSCRPPAAASASARTAPASTALDARSAPRPAPCLNERLRELNNNVEMSVAAYNGGEGRAARVFKQSAGQSFWTDSVYNQFPGETKDYVPMVIAAAWIFLHPQQYGVEFPKIGAQPATLRLARVHHHLRTDHLPGQPRGTRDGYMRALRNLNPRYEADGWIPAGT
jgi:membrane-bound lytic murein transglycosylase D